jgi:hypothetical protein
MVVDAADGDPGSLGNLAHGGTVISIFEENEISGLQDLLAGAFTFGTGCVYHHNSLYE